MINVDNDASLLTKGTWVEYEGSSFLVAHMSNPSFQRAVMRGQAPHRKKIDNGTIDPVVSRDIMSKAMASALVLDWKKVADASGNEVPFSTDVCYKALCNNEDLRDFISDFAMNLENFRKAEKEELGKS